MILEGVTTICVLSNMIYTVQSTRTVTEAPPWNLTRPYGSGGGLRQPHGYQHPRFPLDEPENLPFVVLKATALGGLVVWTIIANVLVFVVLYKNPRLQTVPNFLVGNLAFSDLCLGLVVLPLAAVYAVTLRWSFGKIICEIWLSSDVLNSTASIWNLSIIGLDRYWAITSPITYMNKRTMRSAVYMIAGVWALSMLISVAPFFGWRNSSELGNYVFVNETSSYQCVFLDLPAYSIYSATGSFFIPLAVMFFVYFQIYRAFAEHKARHLYRQKVLKKHIESTILHEISHVLPIPMPRCPEEFAAAAGRGAGGGKDDDDEEDEDESSSYDDSYEEDEEEEDESGRRSSGGGGGADNERAEAAGAKGGAASKCTTNEANHDQKAMREQLGPLITASTIVDKNVSLNHAAKTSLPNGGERAPLRKQATRRSLRKSSARDSSSVGASVRRPQFTSIDASSTTAVVNHGTQRHPLDQKSKSFSYATANNASSPNHNNPRRPLIADKSGNSKIPNRQASRKSPANRKNQPAAISAAKEKRGVKVLGIILGCFAICLTPFFIMYLMTGLCQECRPNAHVEQFITWLGYSNSAMNPIIYTVFNKDYQTALKKLFTRRSPGGAVRKRRPQAV